MLRLISEDFAPITPCKYDFEAEGGGGGGGEREVVVKPNTAGARCRQSGPESVYYCSEPRF